MPTKKEEKEDTDIQSSDNESEASGDEASLSNEEEQEERIPIDLSQNEIYRGVCTLFEDDDGNNILEYISLLHTELIGINKSLENLRLIRKDITRLADCAEFFFKGKKEKQEKSEAPEVSTIEHRKKKSK